MGDSSLGAAHRLLHMKCCGLAALQLSGQLGGGLGKLLPQERTALRCCLWLPPSFLLSPLLPLSLPTSSGPHTGLLPVACP